MKTVTITVIALVLLLAGCGNPPTATTPAAPNSPQTTVALTIKTVADAASSCIDTVIAIRNAGKLSAVNATTIGNWCSTAAVTDKQLTAILANGQPWAAQKSAILTLLATVTTPAVVGTIDPGAQAVIAQIMTLVAQIRTQVTP